MINEFIFNDETIAKSTLIFDIKTGEFIYPSALENLCNENVVKEILDNNAMFIVEAIAYKASKAWNGSKDWNGTVIKRIYLKPYFQSL